jgi:superfamily II DNA or RNA helicase/HKD family nuclease
VGEAVSSVPIEGLYEALLTVGLQDIVNSLVEEELTAEVGMLANAEAADRVSRHVAQTVARFITSFPEEKRSEAALKIATRILDQFSDREDGELDISGNRLVDPGQVVRSIVRRNPDGSSLKLDRPLTPLLDTTVLTNAPGEPAIAHELRAEVPSADAIDIVVAFIRWTGIRGMLDGIRRHCEAGRPARVLTTTYTGSTEQRALDELVRAGADVRVSYDTSLNRLHAKAWVFHRKSGYSTAYVGSSNLTQWAQVTGLEWNVRLSEARNPDAVAKMAAVFESYWQSAVFVPYDEEEFRERIGSTVEHSELLLSPVEVVLRPFQEHLLDQLEAARQRDRHRNLLVAATGTGKTVMAAVDYARMRTRMDRSRLLYVAHREELLEQARSTFRHALRDPSFGERWVGGDRPRRFDHVFASIQSLSASGVDQIPPDHFDVVIVDEFHHAGAPSYVALLEQVRPCELLGLTATPERADGLDILEYFDGRIAAELRLWEAIDQQYLVPFDYFGIHDGLDLKEVPWRRGRGYDPEALTRVFTADHAWANRVLEQVRQKVSDPHSMQALGFCVSIGHARFMAERFSAAGLPSIAIWGDSPKLERQAALGELATGKVAAVFTVDLFNEGVDAPAVDTLLMLRPTDSPTLFIQQLGRGLRKSPNKGVCTVLDFVGTHRKEFRYDRRFRALLGGTRKEVEHHVEQQFPFLPSGCSLQLDQVAQEIVLRSIRNAIPTIWRDKVNELRTLGDVTLSEFLQETGLELSDIYGGNHSWTEMRRAAGLPTLPAGPNEEVLLRTVGRLTHVDDNDRLSAYRKFVQSDQMPDLAGLSLRNQRLLRMFVASITSLRPSSSFDDAMAEVWAHPQVRAELTAVLDLLPLAKGFTDEPLGMEESIPLRAHARYTRLEILAAFGIGAGARPHDWQSGVYHLAGANADLFAFTLDKSTGGFSPTTRYRDYAISRDLIHWESQSTTSLQSETGQRYIHHEERESRIILFARMTTDERALWCLGTARYVRHEGERPIAFVWELDLSLPAELFSSFAAAVA